jgi:hypothetical protein
MEEKSEKVFSLSEPRTYILIHDPSGNQFAITYSIVYIFYDIKRGGYRLIKLSEMSIMGCSRGMRVRY